MPCESFSLVLKFPICFKVSAITSYGICSQIHNAGLVNLLELLYLEVYFNFFRISNIEEKVSLFKAGVSSYTLTLFCWCPITKARLGAPLVEKN